MISISNKWCLKKEIVAEALNGTCTVFDICLVCGYTYQIYTALKKVVSLVPLRAKERRESPTWICTIVAASKFHEIGQASQWRKEFYTKTLDERIIDWIGNCRVLYPLSLLYTTLLVFLFLELLLYDIGLLRYVLTYAPLVFTNFIILCA